jgi:hypothetical protein
MDATIDLLIENALRCYRLAAQCTDPLLARQLREIGAEYSRQAVALGADPETLPGPEPYRNPAGDDSPTSGTPSAD